MKLVRIPFEVETNYAGWRLDRYLQQKLGRASRTQIQHFIRTGLEHDEARVLKPSSRVYAGQTFYLLREALPEPEGLPESFELLYDDADLLVINKPPGLPVHPSARYFEHTVTSILGRAHRDEAGVRPDPAHRLDRETSGVLLCGRGKRNGAKLKQAFAAHDQISKRYLALCEGHLPRRPSAEGGAERIELRWPLALLEEHEVRIRVSVLEDSDPRAASAWQAHTGVELLARLENQDGEPFSLLRCTLHTGRQHQIRAHLAYAGHPVVGDKIYGSDERRFIRFVDGELEPEDLRALRLPHHALHAQSIEFAHPQTGARLSIEAPLPTAFEHFLATLQPSEAAANRG